MGLFDDLPRDRPPLGDYRRSLEEQYGLSRGLLDSMEQVESSGDNQKVSRKGAVGSMQFMPATATEYGINPLDDHQASEGAARYIAHWKGIFGDESKALAAYNAGPRRVMDAGGVPKIAETQGYVQKVLNRLVPAAQADEVSPVAGMFDDLPKDGQLRVEGSPVAGMFDDLPKDGQPQGESSPVAGMFDDLPKDDQLQGEASPSSLAQRDVAPSTALELNVPGKFLIPSDLSGGSHFDAPAGRRLPLQVLDDLRAGRQDIAPEEIADIARSLELGHFKPEDAKALQQALVLRVGPSAQKSLATAAETGQMAAALRSSPGMPGFPAPSSAGRSALEGLVSGLSSHYAETLPAENFPVQRRAAEIIQQEAQAEHPVANLAGELAGGAVNFLPFLRGARAGVEALKFSPTIATRIAEGVAAGIPQGLLIRPEGSENMPLGENAAARLDQAAMNAALGAGGDLALHGVGKLLGPLWERYSGLVAVGKAKQQLVDDARLAGFSDVESYVAANGLDSRVATIVDTPDGPVIRPNAEIIQGLPGETSNVPETISVESGEPVQTAGPGLGTASLDARSAGDGASAPRQIGIGEVAADVSAEGRRADVAGERPPVGAAAAAEDWRAVQSRADEAERLARAANDQALREELLTRALGLRKQADALKAGEAPKLSRAEMLRQRLRVDPESDDLVTAIRKLGGLDVERDSDWAGRLSHLMRRVPGLPGVEQKAGRGRTLDDLAESLRGYGYLVDGQGKRELEGLLGQAETGRPVWSNFKQDFSHLDGEPPPVAASSDLDWHYEAPGTAAFNDHGFIVDGEAGDIVPARLLTEADFLNMIEEERHAEEWFAREKASVEGREYVGSLAETGGVDAARATGGESLLDAERAGTRPAEQRGGLRDDGTTGLSGRVESAPVGRAGYESRPGETASLSGFGEVDANAQVLADLRNAKDGRRSGLDRAEVAPGAGPGGLFSGADRQRDIADFPQRADLTGDSGYGQGQEEGRRRQEVLTGGAAADTLRPTLSQRPGDNAASAISSDLFSLLGRILRHETNLGTKFNNGKTFVYDNGTGESIGYYDGRLNDIYPVLEDLSKRLKSALTYEGRYIPKNPANMSLDEFTVAYELGKIIPEFEIGKNDFDNVLRTNEDGSFSVDIKGLHKKIVDQYGAGVLYANPFGPVATRIALDVGLHPAQHLLGGGLGGYWGGQESDEETGSIDWWMDVAKGAAVGAAGWRAMVKGSEGAGYLLKRFGPFGKVGFLDEWAGKIGTWIESLPLIGRGPVEVREFKRKARVMRELMDKQTAEVGVFLERQFTPEQRAQMADLIETRGIVPDLNLIHRQAQMLDAYISEAGEKLKALGMLSPDIEAGGYLHRYYAKDLDIIGMLKRPFKQSISGSYTLARGTVDPVGREYLSPSLQPLANELADVQGKISALVEKAKAIPDIFGGEELAALKARKKELQSIDIREYLGEQDGQVRAFFFRVDELPRVDTGIPPKLAAVDAIGPGLDPRPMPVAPVGKLTPTERRWTLRGANDKEALLHRDWTDYERQAWGEIKDAGYRYVRGMQEVSHDLSLATLFDRVSRRTDWVTADETAATAAGWVQVPDSRVGKGSPLRRYGNLAGKWMRPDVWNAMRNAGRNPLAATNIGKIYLGALNKWKLFHTADNPVTHFNNLFSNTEMLYLAGYSPKDVAAGVNHLRAGEKSEIYREAQEAGLFGHDWASSIISGGEGNATLADLAERLRNQPEIPDAVLSTSLLMDWKAGVEESMKSIREAKGLRKGEEVLRAMLKPAAAAGRTLAKPYAAYSGAMRKAYGVEDDLFKMAVYQAERAKGSTSEQAANVAEKFFFDYGDLPDAVKFVRDFPIGSPFVSYTYLAAQAMLRNVIERPERVLALIAGFEAANYVFTTAGKDMGPGDYWQLMEAEEQLAPGWEKGRSLFGVRNMMRLPSPEGYRLSLARAHAMGNPFGGEAGGREKLPQMPVLGEMWGSSFLGGSPLHALVDIAINEDWKGKPIYHPKDPEGERWRKGAAYLAQSWGPSSPFVPGSYHQSKIIEGVANQAAEDRKAGVQTLSVAMIDAANAISEALGGGQFTGVDRMDNPIVTRDALLGSVGIKLHPVRAEQWADFADSAVNKDRLQSADRFKKMAREIGAGRRTDAEGEAAKDLLDKQLGEAEKKQVRNQSALDVLMKYASKK